MAKEYVCGLTARKKIGCDKNTFMKLIRRGAIDAERTENGSWRVSSSSIEEYIAANDTSEITRLQEENRQLKEQLERYRGLLSQIKGLTESDMK